MSHVAVKEAVFPFARFPGVDVILGPEMEVDRGGDGLGPGLRARLREGPACRRGGAPGKRTRVHLRAGPRQAERRSSSAAASPSSASRWSRPAARPGPCVTAGSRPRPFNKLLEGPPHIVDALKDDRIDFMINTTESARSVADSSGMRRTALFKNVPYRHHESQGRAPCWMPSPPSANRASTWPPSSPTRRPRPRPRPRVHSPALAALRRKTGADSTRRPNHPARRALTSRFRLTPLFRRLDHEIPMRLGRRTRPTTACSFPCSTATSHCRPTPALSANTFWLMPSLRRRSRRSSPFGQPNRRIICVYRN